MQRIRQILSASPHSILRVDENSVANDSSSLTDELDSRLSSGMIRRRRRDQLTSTAAAEREGTKQWIVERHHVPDGALDRLIPGGPTVRLGDARHAGTQRVEVGQRRVKVGGVDVVGGGGIRLEVGGRGDLMSGG